jgi:hypothetical protein
MLSTEPGNSPNFHRKAPAPEDVSCAMQTRSKSKGYQRPNLSGSDTVLARLIQK